MRAIYLSPTPHTHLNINYEVKQTKLNLVGSRFIGKINLMEANYKRKACTITLNFTSAMCP